MSSFHDRPVSEFLSLLKPHLPYSLPVLRRIQFNENIARCKPPHAHLLLAPPVDRYPHHFAAAYVDLSRGLETQVWLYSTIEDTFSSSADELCHCDSQIIALLGDIGAIQQKHDAKNVGSTTPSSPWVLFGSLNEVIRLRMLAHGVRMSKSPNVPDDLEWEFCDKWVFRLQDLNPGEGLKEGMSWDRIRREDVKFVQSRTTISRTEETLLRIPSVVVRSEDGTPVAWGFMGYDGTLMTLYVEEPYRRMGLAKAVACKVMQDHLASYGDDGWGAADVLVHNDKSQALCKSIGGVNKWKLSW
ncbi:hypothetical protein QBC43DRAFT_101011 [Cladorrhinum sp. PSN259]|nr:hypothetical protein QBC43DRAFT_101011 [Cladorrhinum sp. PSN259]